MDYKPQIEPDRLLSIADKIDSIHLSGTDDQSRDLQSMRNEGKSLFSEFLKKKAFEEFGLDKLMDEKHKRANEQEVSLHKTPVGPWGDGRSNTAKGKVLGSELQSNKAQAEVSMPKPAGGLGNFFNKEHHTNVISKFGGFTTGGDELRRLKKEGNATQNQNQEYRTLYDEPQGQKPPKAVEK